ncbi:hypothetical protein [Streptomyces alkaliphilus]|uniref:Uncharacterized protein n=1 Tax=Streptomyces alkaliphilus TaxID=1472722 RepID=A0A646IH37_9ACTN|nr:hypothetical protein [Streptomyces alkaliphilus]MQS09756.1 hypothetical protein [Streptomyces alkaliphilus]
MKKFFGEEEVEVVSFDDVSTGEAILEFRPTTYRGVTVLLFFVPEGGGWSEARMSVNPDISEVSASFVEWAAREARNIIVGDFGY